MSDPKEQDTYVKWMRDNNLSEEHIRWELRRMELMEQVAKERPDLSPMAAVIVAGDMASSERATELLKGGATPEQALVHVGSFSRMDWALEHLPPEVLYEDLPELWRGADPDDTDPKFLEMWTKAWVWNKHRPLTDRDDVLAMARAYARDPDASKEAKDRHTARVATRLPRGRFLAYRGQAKPRPAPDGISWTLHEHIAEKFARGAWQRTGALRGYMVRGLLNPRTVLGFMVGRGEAEIIVDPADVAEIIDVRRVDVK